MILSIDDARALIHSCMVAIGHPAAEADIISDHLIDCELRGLSFGGLPRALSVVERIHATPTPRKPIEIVKESPVSAALDGGDQVGYLVAHRATEIALKKARATGIAVVTANQTWYTGMFSYYLEKITAAGFMGLVAGSGGRRVAPHGGSEGRFSTNPIAFGFPSEGTPIIWDIGTSAIMLGEVVLAERMGELLPEGLAFAPDGNPTRDPTAALAGAFAVWGGHKGSGLALVVQLLGMMSGASAAPPKLRDCGFFMLLVDPKLLTDADDYAQRVCAFANDLRSTRPLDPTRPVRVPFERSVAEREKRRARNKIEVTDQIYEALKAVAAGA
ncbi:Ldh family oxidoreductase [Caballeronia sp. INDeC2]|uniref:Ldh family oxidoreductase n=1 Tax=Caballeronia sp. INDeC2 TaxID=2921747 RepID=UPI002027C043|nr:Ldh family oxidoreductase [Caballeronia sp. INDeC2]